MSHLERIYWIDGAIRAKQYPSLYRIGEQFGIAKRTVHSDIRYLRERLNAPISFHAKHRGYFYTDHTYQIPRLLLTETEVEAVRRALLAAREYGGIAEDAQILALMTERIGDVFLKTPPHISMESGMRLAPHSRVSATLLDELQTAIRLGQRVRLLYHGNHRDAATERVICPWHLMNYESEWYVTGFANYANLSATFTCQESWKRWCFMRSKPTEFQLIFQVRSILKNPLVCITARANLRSFECDSLRVRHVGSGNGCITIPKKL